MLLNGALTLKELILCKKLLNINDKTVIFLQMVAALQIALITSLIKIIQRIFNFHSDWKISMTSIDIC